MTEGVGAVRSLIRWAAVGYRAEWLLTAFVALCLVGMLVVHAALAPIPFHFIYTAVTIVYGLRLWQTRGVVVSAVGVTVTTGGLTLVNVVGGGEGVAELVEVPMMISMFLSTAWHVRSRQKAAVQVTELAEERRRVLERERAFFANVTHDLMTPLTIAHGHLDILGRAGPPSAADVSEAKRIVIDELRRIESLVGDLLLVGRLDAAAALERAPTDAQELLESIAERWLAVGDRVWDVAIAADGTLVCDGNTLAQALDNIFENAVSYTSAGDRIAVDASSDGDVLVIVVSDTGVGIPPEALPHVFDRFYRGDRSRSRQTGGSGLGLAIVSDVVEAHGGTVAAASAAGEGTRVTVRLPGFVPARARGKAPRRAI